MAESETSRDAVDTAKKAICQAALNIMDDAVAPYLYRQAVTHLLEVGRTDDALGLLTNLDFVQAKVEAGMLFWLISDYHATLPLITSSFCNWKECKKDKTP